MQNIILHKITLFISNVEFSLVFDDMLTLISGESGCGKSLMYRAFRCRSAEDDRIICFDGIDLTNRNIVETVVLLNNKNAKPKDYVEIGIDAEDYIMLKKGRVYE